MYRAVSDILAQYTRLGNTPMVDLKQAMHGPHSVSDIGHCTVIHRDVGGVAEQRKTVYVTAVQSLFLRSFVLFAYGLHSTPEKVETKSTATFYGKTSGWFS